MSENINRLKEEFAQLHQDDKVVRNAYQENLTKYVLAVRDDVDTLIHPLQTGEELTPQKLQMWQDALQHLQQVIRVYSQAAHLSELPKAQE